LGICQIGRVTFSVHETDSTIYQPGLFLNPLRPV
jgi:hypothetical protein